MKKPTGKMGYTRISGNKVSSNSIIFPETKEAIENLIMEKFVENTNALDTFFKFKSFSQNTQNDFDFSVETTIGKNYIDVMEIAILNKGSHDSANNQYNDLEFSENIFKKISEKSRKYGNRKPLFLLIYPTDYKFNLSELSILHLKYLLNKTVHCFEMIFYFSLIDEETGNTRLLFPSEVKEFNEKQYKNNITINLF